ncbi:MAG: transglycosylase domain-containing protein [Lachnospiraceae bacterium]|nr:transglycosylase domain-containing protein [Lachnospiraceae bacterium]
MNLGKRGVQKRLNELDSHSAMLGNKAGVSALRIGLFVIAAVIVCCSLLAFGAYRGIIDGAPDIEDVNIMPLGQATMIYDADGNLIQKLNSSEGNRISVSINEIPEDMQHAIVAIEDSRFYTHNGIDPQGMLRAMAVAVSTGLRRTEGASTITQQLLKNNVFTSWTQETKLQRIRRKLQEQYLAVKLEAALAAEVKDPKAVILENYLNTVNFGSGCYGIQTASQKYFGKPSSMLTLSECAVLAAIPQNPTKWNPINHPEKNADRREKVLRDMRDQSYITEEQYQEALADNVYDRIAVQSESTTTEEPYSYFVDELIVQLKKDLMQQRGYTSVQANNAIYSGGLRIYTTQDPEIQSIMDEEFCNEDNYPGRVTVALDWAMTVQNPEGELQNYSREMLQLYFRNYDPDFDLLFDTEEEAVSYIDQYRAAMVQPGDTIIAEWYTCTPQPQAAMTILDQRTSYVKAIVGGRGEKTASLTLNRATDAYRQPGSTFKILSTYGPALDSGEISLATVLTDEPYNYSDGSPIHNADNSFHGDVTVRTAIQNSYNIPAVKVLDQITPQTGMNYLLRMGFEKLIDDPEWDVIQPLALGGITNGVSNLELTAAYAAIANGGVYTQPTFYTKVVDSAGNIVLEHTPIQTRIFKESTAYLLTNAMLDVITKGTGVDYQLNNMTVAGKTGTTNTFRDLVFAGFTPYYTAAIWAGCDVSLDLPEEYRNYHKGLWTRVMNRVDQTKHLVNQSFPVPQTVKEATICPKTGLLAGNGCSRVTEYFDTMYMPVTHCTQCYVPPTPTPTPTPAPTPPPKPEEDKKEEEEPEDEKPEDEGEEADTPEPPEPDSEEEIAPQSNTEES